MQPLCAAIETPHKYGLFTCSVQSYQHMLQFGLMTLSFLLYTWILYVGSTNLKISHQYSHSNTSPSGTF